MSEGGGELAAVVARGGVGGIEVRKDADDRAADQVSALAGVDTWGDSLVFNPRGQLDNPASDFSCDANNDGSVDGYVCVTFVNKPALAKGRTDSWTVLVSRAGMTRLQHNDDTVGFTAGSALTSTPGTTASGYAGGGGSGSSGDTGGTYSGFLVPYLDAGSNGAATAAGVLKRSITVVRPDGSKKDKVGCALYIAFADIDTSKLPFTSTNAAAGGYIDANAKTDLKLILFR